MKTDQLEKRVTLEEFMEKVDENETLFIGATSGYLFIGNVKRFREDFPKISRKAHRELENANRKLIALINETNDLIAKENEERDGTKLPSIRCNLQEIKRDLFKRKVLDSYEKILEGEESGRAVIISGTESGSFWFKKEYEERRKHEYLRKVAVSTERVESTERAV